jgi:sugar phosphate isomerase/epimerase
LKVGLSTWSLLGIDVYSAVRAIGDAGFDFVELWGEIPHAYPEWVDREKLKDVLASYDMLVTMHAPFTDLNPATPFQPVKGAVEQTLQSCVKLSEYLGAKIVTVHPGSVHNEALVPLSAGNSVRTLQKMVSGSRGKLLMSVENQTKSRSKYHFPLASNAESLDLILADVEGLRFTLDTGHAHANGQDFFALAQREGERLVEVHLSDNMGESDDHLVPGEGNSDFTGFMKHIESTYVFMCLELDPHRYSAERVFQASNSFRNNV